MDTHLLELAGKIAGLAGISVAAALLLFREVIRRNILPRLSQRDAFSLIRLLCILMFILSACGIATWGYIQTVRESPRNEIRNSVHEAKQPLAVAGRAVDEASDDPIGQAAVTISGRAESYVTEDNGNFRIQLDASTVLDHRVRIRVSKQNYLTWDGSVEVPGENLIIQLRRLHQ
jgi:hypothetical protein